MSLDLTTSTDLSAPNSSSYLTHAEPPTPAGQEAPLRLVGAALRGRYRLAVILAVLLGSAGAVVGWMAGKPLYRSGVPIRMTQNLPTVLHADTDRNQLQSFDRFVETQIAFMQDDRVIIGAVDRLSKDNGWRRTHIETGPGNADNAIIQLAANLSIIRNNELIKVYVQDPDREYAKLGAQAIVDTYKSIFVVNDTAEENNIIGLLRTAASNYEAELQDRKRQIASLTASYGTENVQEYAQGELAEVNDLQHKLDNLQLNLALLGVAAKDGEKQSLSVEQLAELDLALANMMQTRDRLEDDLATMSARWGLEHSQVQAVQTQLNRLTQKIADRVRQLRDNPQLLPQVANRAGDLLVQDPERIKAQIAQLSGLLEKHKAKLSEYYKVSSQVSALREECDNFQKSIDEVHNRINNLNLQSQVGGHITVLDDAQRPLQPFTDTRRKLAALGGTGGALGGLMLVVVFGLLDRRLRHADEIGLRLGLNQILGMLPTLPGDLSNPEEAAIAAHAVHHIRTILQIRARDRNGVPILVVTSPAAGTGKTSLVLGLGLSFASTGSRTLLIDCDLIGGGLTTRMNTIVKRKLGRILVERKLITEAQLLSALRDIQGKNIRLGERLFELGFLKKTDLEDSLRIQNRSNAGLIGALKGEPLDKCVVRSGLPGLWVLPLSENDMHHASSLSPTAIGALFKEVRRHFDTILIDTGPVPGSLEASVVAAQADGVLAIISRGESSRAVGRCLDHLRTVGATMMGIVFNRANEADMAMRGTTKRISSTLRASDTQSDAAGPPEAAHRGDFGPVARAVARAATSSNGSRRSSAPKNGNKQ